MLRLWQAWRETVLELYPLGYVSFGNRVQVFDDGDGVFVEMESAIAGAQREVVLSTYILDADAVGRRILAALTAAAERGCEVTLVVDGFGSHRLDAESLAPLRASGARVVVYNPVLRWRPPVSRLVRNHQKILAVDDEVGFCGGMNVAEEYCGSWRGTGAFRDAHLKLTGPCVRDLAGLAKNAARDDDDEEHWEEEEREPPAPEDGGSLVQILESNVRRQRRAIQQALRTTIRRAVERCTLVTPYFVPPVRLKNELVRAARRGVDVRVLTAGRSDVPIVRMASQHLYGRLLDQGVRIYELEGRTLHAKTAAIDGVYATVGSFNLDRWSDRRNLEVNVSVLGRALAGEIEEAFERDLADSREVTLESWERRTLFQRITHWLAYQAMRI